MCGICGIVDPNISTLDKKDIVIRMSNVMIHRGPDHFGYVDLSEACIGMRRLSIIDLSAAGNQPMSNEEKSIWCICNGEIYNYVEQREYLLSKGHCLNSTNDTEIIVHLYEEFDEECVHKLRGMFAFAIWDEKKRKLFVARDRLGIKPLYYSFISGRFCFASEVKAILKGQLSSELDINALDAYLSFGYIPPPMTMFKNIISLLPGHCINFKSGKIQIKKWWSLPEQNTTQCNEKEIVPYVRHLLEESIRLHQVSDVPVGAFLSGGIDSTSVVGLMSKINEKPIKTFSIGFGKEVSDDFNELSLAGLVAKKFNTEHSEIILTGQDVAEELDNIIWYLDQPSFDGVNTYFVSRAAKQGGLTVALSGLGGDELFGGYGSYQVIPRLGTFINLWSRLPEVIRSSVANLLSSMSGRILNGNRKNKVRKLGWVDSTVALYALARFNLWPNEKKKLYSQDIHNQFSGLSKAKSTLSILESYTRPGSDQWGMVTELELQTYMNWRLLRDTDVMSMAHSLEVRVPLIDHMLVEFVCGLPKGWHKSLGYPKKLLTQALSDCLPDQIINTPKHGFEFPMEYWMKNELKEIVEDVLSEKSINKRGFFSVEGIHFLYNDFKNGNISYPVIWQFVVLELWLRKNYDNNYDRN